MRRGNRNMERRMDVFEHRQQRMEDVLHLNNQILVAQNTLFRDMYPNYTGPSQETISTFFDYHGVYDVNARHRGDQGEAGGSQGGN